MTKPVFCFSEKAVENASVTRDRLKGARINEDASVTRDYLKRVRISFVDRQGMTIIEVMVAFAVIAVVAVLMIAGFSAVATMNARNADRVAVDENLTYGIAIEGSPSGATSGALVLDGINKIPIQAETFGDSDQGYTVFSYEP